MDGPAARPAETGRAGACAGRAFEPSDVLRFDLSTVISGPGRAVAVTEGCVLWVSRDDDRWVRTLPVRPGEVLWRAHAGASVRADPGP
jgi:hypothetical protein